LLGQNTIDEYIYNIIEKKRAMVAQVTGAENDIQTEMSMVDDLIGLFSGKK
jgi:SNF2 family DNA or RNA helicase